MKRHTTMRCVLFIVYGAYSLCAYAQGGDLGQEIDLLKAPASPASNMLGIASEEVTRPTDLTSFMLGLRQASDEFTKLPSNYAIDIAPLWLFDRNGKKANLTKMVMRQGGDTAGSSWGERVLQGTVFSTAVKGIGTGDTSSYPETGIGFRMALFTPPVNKEAQTRFNSLRALHKAIAQWDSLELARAFKSVRYEELKQKQKDPKYSKAEQDSYGDSASYVLADLLEKQDPISVEDLKRSASLLAEGFAMDRQGFFMDFSAGLALEFVDRDFNNGQFNRGGFWLTTGYTCPGFTTTAMGRMIFEPPVEIVLEDSTTRRDNVRNGDLGVSIAFDQNGRPFTFSLEGLMRWQQIGDTKDDTWRLVANASYAFKANKAVTFSFGRNFDGTNSSGGNLVAALNLLLGFGGDKRLDAPAKNVP